ncbi:hypothetical protein PAP_09015 [Palaeococcus pacificus DY20341]|uniref:Glutaredoxin domain-containing protein n=1 Tax=Palaeococcus pacificus DY20341 TaxID=1343739 RepID=A0A075M054_9EURY|nr:glutaredoxin domain-containing protein [Palaeococcus pacificus]AIF70183.1 hypothetical protein PAP_09015 [Palaeococcus pacificus DY20341]
MRKAALFIVFLFLASAVSLVLADTQIDKSKVHFYMYGTKTCPHCKKMKEEIPKQFGEQSLTYYELIDNEENGALFSEVYQLTGISGVPAIGIAYDNKLYAIIEGEFNVSATTEIIKTAQENNGLILFVGGKAYILKNETHIEMLEKLFIEHKSALNETQTSSTQSPSKEGICGPGLIFAFALVPLLFKRRR